MGIVGFKSPLVGYLRLWFTKDAMNDSENASLGFLIKVLIRINLQKKDTFNMEDIAEVGITQGKVHHKDAKT